MDLTISRLAVILVAVPLLTELLLCWLVVVLFLQLEGERARFAQASEVTTHLTRLAGGFCNLTDPAILSTVANDEDARQRLYRQKESTLRELAEISGIAACSCPQQKALRHLVKNSNSFMSRLSEAHDLANKGDRGAATRAWIDALKYEDGLLKEVGSLMVTLRSVEGDKPLVGYQQTIFGAMVALVLMNILVSCFLLWLFNWVTVSRLKAISGNALRFAAGQPLAPSLPSHVKEVDWLDRKFREMAAKLTLARQQQRASIDNSADVICSIDANGKLTEVSNSCRMSWGYAPDELNQVRLSEIIDPLVLDETLAILKQATGCAHPMNFQTRLRTKERRLVETFWSVSWAAQEKSLYCVVHDLSGQKRLAKLKQQFISVIREDLKAPLTRLQPLHESLSAQAFGPISPIGLNRLGSLQREVARLIGLVDDILDIQKLDTGKLEFSIEQAALRPLLNESIESVANFGQRQKVDVVLGGSSDIWLAVDRRRMIQVFVNLISNAIKYSPPGSTVVVFCEHDGDFATVSVIDKGQGIPEPLHDVIFERFRQAESADQRARGGKGLGLTICKAIVEGHGGSIGVSSGEGIGSRFWVRLPRTTNRIRRKTAPSGEANP